MGNRIWVVIKPYVTGDGTKMSGLTVGPFRVLSFSGFHPADPNGPSGRKKHLVKLWTDPGGMRTLNVGSIRLKDPGKVAAGLRAAETRRELQDAEEVAAEEATWD